MIQIEIADKIKALIINEDGLRDISLIQFRAELSEIEWSVKIYVGATHYMHISFENPPRIQDEFRISPEQRSSRLYELLKKYVRSAEIEWR